MGRTAVELTGRAEDMRHAYASSVLAWIRDEQPSDRLLDLAQEATAHARACSWCTASGILSTTCYEGRRLAAALLAPAEDCAEHCDGAALTHDETGVCTHPTALAAEEAPCAHESWSVTSEYADRGARVWVKSRRCNDCREPLPQIREVEPQFHSPAEVAVLFGHATPEQTATAFFDKDQDEDQGEDRPELPTALPLAKLLRGDESCELLGELNLALQYGHGQREGETHDQRAGRILGEIDRVLGSWRHALEHRRPTTYITNDGRAVTNGGEHKAKEGVAVYESPTSPKAYTVEQLKGMYRWVAAIEGGTLGNGEMVTAPFEEYARTCRIAGLVPATAVLIPSRVTNTVYAAAHIALSPDLQLADSAVAEIRTALADGLADHDE
jgi:hypothetical protein